MVNRKTNERKFITENFLNFSHIIKSTAFILYNNTGKRLEK